MEFKINFGRKQNAFPIRARVLYGGPKPGGKRKSNLEFLEGANSCPSLNFQ